MRRTAARLRIGVIVAAGLVAASCGVSGDVATERSDQIAGDLSVDRGPTFGTNDDSGTAPADPAGGGTSAPSTSLTWGGCTAFDIPSVGYLGTAGWECATLTVPMDPLGAGGDGDAPGLELVELALTRHPATGERQGSLLLNPGGPGGSGLEVAWGLRSDFPANVLRAFDIVSWDPRGVGQSRPAVQCGDDPDIGGDFLMAECAEATGDLAAYLAAPYSAADMEAIRVALGETRLNYLGYSYGSALGATYAEAYPKTVGRFVLDGVTDPLIGGPDGLFIDGFPRYAIEGVDAAATRFEELCDSTERCDLGPDSQVAIDEIFETVGDLPTNEFEFDPETINGDAFIDLMISSLSFAGDWELLGTALGDARNGDASALASLTSVDPGIGSDALGEPATSFELANLVIYCADFAPVITEWNYCDGLPSNEFTLEPVVSVDIAEPMLIIGTEYDPLTPGIHAPEFADAIGDAVHMIWEGVGHTAFPAPTSCINRAVSDYLVDGQLPSDATRCEFLSGLTNDNDLADELFGHGGAESERLLTQALEFRDGAAQDVAACMARAISRLEDRTISHVILNVTSDDAEAALSTATAAC